MNAFVLPQIVVGVWGILLLWVFAVRPLIEDNYRADIRRLRDGLFDFMWQNGYSFDEPGYLDARRTLNGMLRVSRHISPFRLFLMYRLCRDAAGESHATKHIGTFPDEKLAMEVVRVTEEAMNRSLRHWFLENFVGWLILPFWPGMRRAVFSRVSISRRGRAPGEMSFLIERQDDSPIARYAKRVDRLREICSLVGGPRGNDMLGSHGC